jgi:hypothetical protein
MFKSWRDGGMANLAFFFFLFEVVIAANEKGSSKAYLEYILSVDLVHRQNSSFHNNSKRSRLCSVAGDKVRHQHGAAAWFKGTVLARMT